MALIQWKQIESDLAGSSVLTGSLYVSGAVEITGDLLVDDFSIVDATIFRKTGSYYATNENIHISGSVDFNFDGVQDYFAISIAGEEKFKVNGEGVVEYKPQETTPTAVTGGLFYSSSDSYFLGFNS